MTETTIIERTIVKREGIGFLGLLTIALVVLKIMGYTDISWIWVFSPLWLPMGIVIFIIIILIMVSTIIVLTRVFIKAVFRW
jgi:uncharacterized membrane protein YhiD involved in acid resistance